MAPTSAADVNDAWAACQKATDTVRAAHAAAAGAAIEDLAISVDVEDQADERDRRP